MSVKRIIEASVIEPDKQAIIRTLFGINPVYSWNFLSNSIEDTLEATRMFTLHKLNNIADKAKEKGFTQVLWLDAAERKYVEEVGTMNMVFVIEDEVITAPLTGSILPGITRDSALHLVKEWGLKVSERSLAIDDVIKAAKEGRLKEAFGTGTAAVISPVGQITYKGEDHIVGNGKMGELSQRLYNEIVGIQYGEKEDPYGWREKIL